MKDIKDYLHFYLGCEIVTPDGIGWLASVSRDRRKMDGLLLSTRINVDFKTIRLTENSIDGYDKKRNHGAYLIDAESYVGINAPAGTPPEFTMPGGCKPILRPLSDMTEEEINECWKLLEWSEMIKNNRRYKLNEEFHDSDEGRECGWFSFLKILPYLLSKHFDLFGLIESGLAIDKTKHP